MSRKDIAARRRYPHRDAGRIDRGSGPAGGFIGAAAGRAARDLAAICRTRKLRYSLPMLKTRSIRSPATRADGLRILVSRYRGHGVPKDACDVWMPSLGPSERLLKSFLADKTSWAEFRKRYREEILPTRVGEPDSPRLRNHGQKYTLRLLKKLSEKQTVTLMCHCPDDEPHCHLRVLAPLIKKI